MLHTAAASNVTSASIGKLNSRKWCRSYDFRISLPSSEGTEDLRKTEIGGAGSHGCGAER